LCEASLTFSAKVISDLKTEVNFGFFFFSKRNFRPFYFFLKADFCADNWFSIVKKKIKKKKIKKEKKKKKDQRPKREGVCV